MGSITFDAQPLELHQKKYESRKDGKSDFFGF